MAAIMIWLSWMLSRYLPGALHPGNDTTKMFYLIMEIHFRCYIYFLMLPGQRWQRIVMHFVEVSITKYAHCRICMQFASFACGAGAACHTDLKRNSERLLTSCTKQTSFIKFNYCFVYMKSRRSGKRIIFKPNIFILHSIAGMSIESACTITIPLSHR